MIKWLLLPCGVMMTVCGIRDGLNTQLGFIELCYGVYMVVDVSQRFAREASK